MLEYRSATGYGSPNSDSSGKPAISASARGGAAVGSADHLPHFPINEFGLTPFNLQNSPMGSKLGGMIGKLFKKTPHDVDMFSLVQSPLPHGAVPVTAVNDPSAKGPEVCWIPIYSVYIRINECAIPNSRVNVVLPAVCTQNLSYLRNKNAKVKGISTPILLLGAQCLLLQ